MAEAKITRPAYWLVPHPLHQYAEDVKSVARKAGLRVLDPAVASDEDKAAAMPADKAPKLTIVNEPAPAKKAAAPKE